MENDKQKRYNLYYIIAENMQSEEASLKSYYDMLFFIMQQADKYKDEGESTDHEQK